MKEREKLSARLSPESNLRRAIRNMQKAEARVEKLESALRSCRQNFVSTHEWDPRSGAAAALPFIDAVLRERP